MNNTENNLPTFDEVIEASFDFSEYTPEEKEATLHEISQMITEASLLRAFEGADETTQNAFAELMEQDSVEPETLGDFIKEHFPNFHDIVLEEIYTFHALNDQA